MRRDRDKGSGFTVVEILIVVAILAIAAVVAVPMMTWGADMHIRSAADMIAADLEYARSMVISRQKMYAVVFDKSAERYQIEDSTGVIDHPVKKGFKYIMNFSSDSRLSRVDIVDADFDGTSRVKFDYLGSPYNGDNNPLNNGVVSLQAGAATMTVAVEPLTGFVSIAD